ncbi:MAG: ribosome-associated translation inhibitor RaiA [Planctomycetaceae bacterium]|nr:ribosome-associated translation inhibitor RaiA [Planctomycetaceae bacterium]
MNIIVNARHMDATDPIKDYVQSKVAKLERLYDNMQSIEVILDIEAEQPKVEIVATARRKNTFVASHRGEDLYACVDQCLDKVSQQVRRHKDRVRDRQGPSHEQTLAQE